MSVNRLTNKSLDKLTSTCDSWEAVRDLATNLYSPALIYGSSSPPRNHKGCDNLSVAALSSLVFAKKNSAPSWKHYTFSLTFYFFLLLSLFVGAEVHITAKQVSPLNPYYLFIINKVLQFMIRWIDYVK
jgi:hypothetical protein